MNNRILKTIIVCTLVVLLVSQRYSGMMIPFVTIALIISFLSSAYVCYKNPQEIKIRIIKASIWILGLILASSVHFYMYTKTRDIANIIAEAINLYYQKNNKYPRTPKEFGFSGEELHDQHIFYNNEDEPYLMYPSTFMPFDVYQYDFKNHTWQYQPS